MIKASFFSKFLTKEGPKVLHQVPSGAVVPSSDSSPGQANLFDFSTISEYLIPRQEFCDRLVSICVNRYRVIGYPVCITSQSYARNELIFNFSLVLEETTERSAYESVVRKIARLLRGLEEQNGFVSADTERASPLGEASKIYALCEMTLEDLNNYCECMIPIDDSNTINIKLFPTYPPPPPVKAWHVPLSTVRLESVMDENWDLTMQKVVPHINGVNSVHRIAELADASLPLVRKCIAHLLYYGCLVMLDVFQFGAIYAPTAEMGAFVRDPATQAECARYVSINAHHRDSSGGSSRAPLDPTRLVALYTSLKQGQTLRSWCAEHADAVAGLDVRRFVTFGVIKGFLYRVHKYAVATSPSPSRMTTAGGGGGTPVAGSKTSVGSGGGRRGELPLSRYLDGKHCFDQICTEMEMSEKEVLSKLRSYGDVFIIHR